MKKIFSAVLGLCLLYTGIWFVAGYQFKNKAQNFLERADGSAKRIRLQGFPLRHRLYVENPKWFLKSDEDEPEYHIKIQGGLELTSGLGGWWPSILEGAPKVLIRQAPALEKSFTIDLTGGFRVEAGLDLSRWGRGAFVLPALGPVSCSAGSFQVVYKTQKTKVPVIVGKGIQVKAFVRADAVDLKKYNIQTDIGYQDVTFFPDETSALGPALWKSPLSKLLEAFVTYAPGNFLRQESGQIALSYKGHISGLGQQDFRGQLDVPVFRVMSAEGLEETKVFVDFDLSPQQKRRNIKVRWKRHSHLDEPSFRGGLSRTLFQSKVKLKQGTLRANKGDFFGLMIREILLTLLEDGESWFPRFQAYKTFTTQGDIEFRSESETQEVIIRDLRGTLGEGYSLRLGGKALFTTGKTLPHINLQLYIKGLDKIVDDIGGYVARVLPILQEIQFWGGQLVPKGLYVTPTVLEGVKKSLWVLSEEKRQEDAFNVTFEMDSDSSIPLISGIAFPQVVDVFSKNVKLFH